MGRDTKLIIFCSTVNKDVTYNYIQKYFNEKGNVVITYTSIKEGKVDNLEDILDQLKEDGQEQKNDSDTDTEVENGPILGMRSLDMDDIDEEKNKKKKRKEQYISPEIIFIFDDLSTELRTPSLAKLVKSHRHFKSKVIISTQYPHDLLPESIKQLDYVLLGSNHTIDKLRKLHIDLDLSIPFDEFVRMYQVATEQKYSFFYINVVDEEYRVNFNYKFNKYS